MPGGGVALLQAVKVLDGFKGGGDNDEVTGVHIVKKRLKCRRGKLRKTQVEKELLL